MGMLDGVIADIKNMSIDVNGKRVGGGGGGAGGGCGCLIAVIVIGFIIVKFFL